MPISEEKQIGSAPDNHRFGQQLLPKCHYVKGKKYRFSGMGTICAPNLNILLITILGVIPMGLINSPIPAAATPAAFNATSPIDNSLMTFNATSPIDNSLMTFNATSPVTDNALTNNLTTARP
ncbi:MAG: hypothetical protein M3M87_05260 [Thermoproteota archaeon]|nr:hypothetical protein [Thermoproteota archaeon]